MRSQDAYYFGLSVGTGWALFFLVFLFGFLGSWLGAVVATKITEGVKKDWHTPVSALVWGGFTLLGGMLPFLFLT